MMTFPKFRCWLLISILVCVMAGSAGSASMTGELKQWHKVTLTFDGPQTSETATPNPCAFARWLVSCR